MKKLKTIKNEPFEKIYFGEDSINLPNYPGYLNDYLYERITKYRNNKDYYLPKLSNLKKINDSNIEGIITKLSNDNELKYDDLNVSCLNAGIDLWFEYTNFQNLLNNKNKKNIDLSLLTKISYVIDNAIISNQIYKKIEDYVLFFPSNHLRFIDPNLNNFN